jgi:hypothetical protein
MNPQNLIGRKKGEPQTLGMRLAAERNWKKMRIEGAVKTLRIIASEHCCYDGDLEVFIAHIQEVLMKKLDDKWQFDRKLLKKADRQRVEGEQNGTSKVEERSPTESTESTESTKSNLGRAIIRGVKRYVTNKATK